MVTTSSRRNRARLAVGISALLGRTWGLAIPRVRRDHPAMVGAVASPPGARPPSSRRTGRRTSAAHRRRHRSDGVEAPGTRDQEGRLVAKAHAIVADRDGARHLAGLPAHVREGRLHLVLAGPHRDVCCGAPGDGVLGPADRHAQRLSDEELRASLLRRHRDVRHSDLRRRSISGAVKSMARRQRGTTAGTPCIRNGSFCRRFRTGHRRHSLEGGTTVRQPERRGHTEARVATLEPASGRIPSR
jgi:hypothetical protein